MTTNTPKNGIDVRALLDARRAKVDADITEAEEQIAAVRDAIAATLAEQEQLAAHMRELREAEGEFERTLSGLRLAREKRTYQRGEQHATAGAVTSAE